MKSRFGPFIGDVAVQISQLPLNVPLVAN